MEPGLDFVIAFWGCMYAGAVAIPVYPPYPGTLAKDLPKFGTLVKDSGAVLALTNQEYSVASKLGSAAAYFGKERASITWPEALHWISVDTIPERHARDFSPIKVDPNSLAFFQYSSGSTSSPKAIMVSHSNIIGQIKGLWDTIEPSDVCISWLPSYHDMGLVGFIIVPAVAACHCVSTSPISFIKDPCMWTRMIDRYRGTHTCAPNFGYALVAKRTRAQDAAKLDLRSLKQAICAAEPIRAEVLDAFIDRFSASGFDASTFNCGYGLAETTLVCCGQDPLVRAPPLIATFDKNALEVDRVAKKIEKGAVSVESVTLVGCGKAHPGLTLKIVDAGSCKPLGENCVGEIWVTGSSVAAGYWGREELTKSGFKGKLAGSGQVGKWLRTGDLGFLHKNQVFINGRIKDLIIINGRNIAPQDIESSVENCNAAIRPGCSAAFSVDLDSTEKLVVVMELRTVMADSELRAVASAVRRAVFLEQQMHCHEVVLLMPRAIPKTTSGKIQRHAAKIGFLQGTLKVQLASSAASATGNKDSKTGSAQGTAVTPPQITNVEEAEAWLINEAKARLAAVGMGEDDGGSVATVTPSTTWASLGLDSVTLVQMSADLGDNLGCVVPPAAFFEYPTIRQLARAPGLIEGNILISSAPTHVGVGVGVGEDLSEARKQGFVDLAAIPEDCFDIAQFPEWKGLQQQIKHMKDAGVHVPYLQTIDVKQRLQNFNTYNYIGLAGHKEVAKASKKAIDTFGTSLSSSPIVGQHTLHVDLAHEIASFLGTEAACVFIGGWQTNVSAIDALMSPGDLILCDALNHNCCVAGQKLSGATIQAFPHNNAAECERIVAALRPKYRRVMIVIEGAYSMDGDYPNLPHFVRIKEKYKCLLYIDEAHSIGVMGKTGKGLTEHWNVDVRNIDVIMGTMSKSLGSCGGFIAGSVALCQLLQFTAGGFVFSCGMTPAAAAAALASLRLLQKEPERVADLQQKSQMFLNLLKKGGLNTGHSLNTAVIPVIVGCTIKTCKLSENLKKVVHTGIFFIRAPFFVW
jgi:7-keto-8-aminopelargonate synthetase-like enzyme/acyl-CoA synthetase (AMP-forming)/AMP-acid ligase II/acyl carrier protein